MCSRLKINVRPSTVDDVDDLFNLITFSTSAKSKISKSELGEYLFGFNECEGPEIANPDPIIDFNAQLLKTNEPISQALLAEVNNSLAGYIISHYHYSPWQGNSIFIDDIFVSPEYRKRGVARQLLKEWTERCKRNNLKYVLFAERNFDPEMMKNLFDHGCEWLRNNEKGWSVLRIHFK